MQVELQDTINSILYDPKDYEENIGTEFGSGISEVRVGNQRCKRFMKFTFNHDHQSIQYSLKHVPVIASSDYAAVDDCFQQLSVTIPAQEPLFLVDNEDGIIVNVNVIYGRALWQLVEIDRVDGTVCLYSTNDEETTTTSSLNKVRIMNYN